MDAPSGALVAIDWGTSSCRAYLMDGAGTVLAQRQGPYGIMQVPKDGAAKPSPAAFEAALRRLCGDWLMPGVAVLACGMIGSDQGWVEAPYQATPTDLRTLGARLATATCADGSAVHVVPGLLRSGLAPDVIRGEETQLRGLAQAGAGTRRVCLPGTHTKWVTLDDAVVRDFVTALTGELYALLTAHSILARYVVEPLAVPDWPAFTRGVELAAATPGGPQLTLFSSRALGLTHRLAPEQQRDYLSGLLIAHELLAVAAAFAGEGTGPQAEPLVVSGDAALCERYRRAAGQLGWQDVTTAADGAPEGLALIAREAELLPGGSS